MTDEEYSVIAGIKNELIQIDSFLNDITLSEAFSLVVAFPSENAALLNTATPILDDANALYITRLTDRKAILQDQFDAITVTNLPEA